MNSAACETLRTELKELDRALDHLDSLGCVVGLLSEGESNVSPDALAALGDAIETLVSRARGALTKAYVAAPGMRA